MRAFTALLFVSACASDPAPPSCLQAFSHYYMVGCAYHDINGNPITQDMMVINCQQAAATSPSQHCTDVLNSWLECNVSVPDHATTNAQCDCSQTQMAVLACH